jgi:AcrR family transcriptional regulator
VGRTANKAQADSVKNGTATGAIGKAGATRALARAGMPNGAVKALTPAGAPKAPAKAAAARSLSGLAVPRVPAKANTSSTAEMTAAAAPRTRLGPRERERMIVDGAVRFFAEAGFSGQTRELSRRLAITQPLLYRYFPSKKALIDRVYKEVFLGNWDASWEERLADRSRPLRERLLEFYRDYVGVLFTPEWIRLYMYSGLAGIGFNRRYIARFERLILKRIGLELRHEFGAARRGPAALKPEEIELIWQLHGGIFYYGVRRFIYGAGTHVDTQRMLEGAVGAILAVGREMFTAVPAVAPRKPAARKPANAVRKPAAAKSTGRKNSRAAHA